MRNALDAHLVIAPGQWQDADALKQQVRQRMRDRFGIRHSTLEIRRSRHACEGAAEIGD
ncbi:MAG: hypothetical protein R3E68_14580 [Burkholderiaceae bacterium]